MLRSSTRQANMNKENIAVHVEESMVRVTRARAKALSATAVTVPSSRPPLKDTKNVSQTSFKRAAADEKKISAPTTAILQRKRRAVLGDVTNTFSESSHATCINASKRQVLQITKSTVIGSTKLSAKMPMDVSVKIAEVPVDPKTKLAEDLSKIRMAEREEINLRTEQKENILLTTYPCIKSGLADLKLSIPAGLERSQNKEDDLLCKNMEASNHLCIVDVDSRSKDPQACSLYAPDIYKIIHVTELDQMLSTNYMEQLQRDVTANMRGILIDWLVEVSEEYKLVPDTLYLTTNIIDRFLSKKYLEKQKLQLLGVTCMLIASKYEEICSPRVEEFCFITDSTYTKEQVLEMESEVLNLLHFQLSVPTTKTFLRRFIQVAQACLKVPCVELEFLANYLTELTLVEYKFVKFLPSLIAASAVFLAKWTINQSNHPWSPTLAHYTTYNTSELKTTVIALESLQLNADGSSLNAIREKYKQQKFKCVATFTSAQSVQTLF